MSYKMVSFRIRRARNQEFFFAVLAANNKTLCSSETYHRIGGVHKALKALILGLQLDRATIRRVDDKKPSEVESEDLNEFLP